MDMDKHGIHTIPKGDCASCGKAILGQVVIALGKMWHPEHYVCCHCGEEIGHQNFFERGGKAYCENDYHDLFSPRCANCNGPIRDVSFFLKFFKFFLEMRNCFGKKLSHRTFRLFRMWTTFW